VDSAIIGIASTYNPFRPGYQSGGKETASGELYDPTAWTAAIQTNLRARFGGVGYQSNYQPTYALVSSQDKQAIVKINDVRPLKPGRVIDLNEQTTR
jgi:rare lipoprotein A